MRFSSWKALAIVSLLLPAPAFGGPSGADIRAEMLATIGAYDDPKLTAYLDGLVISEVMYHPRDTGETIEQNDLEYVEIYNPTDDTAGDADQSGNDEAAGIVAGHDDFCNHAGNETQNDPGNYAHLEPPMYARDSTVQ